MDHRMPGDAREGTFVRRSSESTNTRQRSALTHPLVNLQRMIGNSGVTHLLAQRAAEEDELQLQRESEEEEDEGELQLQRAGEEDELQLQRESEEEEDEGELQLQRAGEEEDEVQLKGEPGLAGGTLSDGATSQIQSMRGHGAPLSPAIQATMEANFDTSFADVRVHTDAQSSTLNRSLTSRAFTTGSDIFLRSDQSAGDQRLLAHELTHVVQQRGMGGGAGGMHVGPAGDSYETQADAVASSITSAPAPAQRAADEPAD